ncbi:MAG: DUF1499 domain-containing protein [Bosea sp. (in: a-proteobacteria)]
MRNILWIFGTLGLTAVIAFSIAIWRGDERFGIAFWWERLAGAADLGAVDFTGIVRSASGNDALICPPDLCGAAKTDGVAPVFLAPVARLRDAVRVIEVNDPDVFPLARDEAKVQDRYLARTRLLRFPDTISVRFIDLGNGHSTLALYSRSQIGRSDFGVNKARLAEWIRLLREKLPVANP